MNIIDNKRVDTLRVPGASLYYTARGIGPALLMIAGGGGDADSFDSLAGHLAGQYTVVTYDRRGYSRSPLDNAELPITIEMHSEDAYYLLAALGNEPAYVFGCSIGALIGLELAIRHPAQVRLLVAHEPPVRQLLRDAEQHSNLLRMYREEGATEAIKKFAASIGVNHHDQMSNVGLRQANARIAEHNREAFFQHDAGAVGRYRLDIAALRAAPTRIVLAGGCEGRAFFPYRCTVALAGSLGTAVVEFPGNHAGFVRHPREFGAKLRDIFSD